MNIETERCIIREFVMDDVDSFMEYRNNLDWMRHQGFKGMSKEAYEDALLKNASIEKGKQFAIVNKVSNQLIGDIYLQQENTVYWLGYTVNPVYSLQGYAKEAVNGIINWVKAQEGTIIKAGVLAENAPSIKLLEKMGFTYLTKENDELIYTYNLQQT